LQGANRFLFAGREWIKELRLYDYRARMYQPELGRFLQPDPQEFAAGDYNLYRYCHNDPVNKSDPTGFEETASDIQRDFQWDVARYSDAANTSQGSFADFTHGAYMGNTGGGGSATVTGMPTRQANPAPESDTPTSDSTKSMKMTIAMDPANPGQPSFEDGGDHRIFHVQLTQPNGKAQDGRGYYAQEEIKVRVNQCSGDDCVNGAFKVRTTNGKPLYEVPRSGQAADRVGMGYHPAPGTSGTVIKDQRWWLQHGTEYKTLLPGVLRQTTTTNGGKSYNSIAPTSVPW
jgi:RHS repeat-associated protein